MSPEDRYAIQTLGTVVTLLSKRVVVTLCIALLLLLTLDGFIWCDEGRAAGKYVVSTKYTRLVFASAKDMRKFNSSIDFDSGGSFGGLFSSPSEQEVKNELIAKVDALFSKVQRILDMRKKMQKVLVNVSSNKEQLHQEYYRLFKAKCTLRGWYLFERNTVYLNVQDVHEGMLAHELAHAIIDHFLAVRPPRASAEILARYVDKHLFEKVRTY